VARKPFVLLMPTPATTTRRADMTDGWFAGTHGFIMGAEVEVRTRYLNRWARGFEIVAVDDDGIRLRRQSDGAILPVAIGLQDVRPRQ
jgi:hypothetical protein